MKKTILALILLLGAGLCTTYADESSNPKADPDATVIAGKARFTILTPRLLRLEWNEKGVFEDHATLAIINRNLPIPDYKVQQDQNKTVITTDALVLTYRHGGDQYGKFVKENLSVDFLFDENGRKGSWYPGMDDSGNLLGTTRTLDGCDGHRVKEPYCQGVVSRDGWALIDESDRHLIVNNDSDWKEWVEQRDDTDKCDWYLFAYGHDYKSAVRDFTKVAGRIPLPPKYAFGYWWSKYWQYSDFEFVDLAKQFKSLSIPIDVMIIDMDWHETWSEIRKTQKKDEFGQRVGWTGYTWQKQLFPNPQNFLEDIHALGLKTSLNLHPASGIQPYEECYDRFVEDYLDRTTRNGSSYDGPKDYLNADGKKVPVPFRICDIDWACSYFDTVIRPLEKMGVDFWWLDWQQWKISKYTKNLNNTFWLNHTFFNDKLRGNAAKPEETLRPMIYHRWGGLGSHRYQIGFSGDTYDKWDALRYLPYFTATACNVGYGYWGHDIGGHMQKKKRPTEPEMFTRWLQYGVFTPIFKTHSSKSAYLERRIWMYPEYFDTMRAAIRLRYTLSPYIYTAARQTYDTGLSICRPMYYDYPEEDLAYSSKEQYMFGDDILATVLCTPADKTTGLTSRSVWFPAGDDWYDMATGVLYKGGQVKELEYTIHENPYYVKAGAILPLAAEDLNSLQETSSDLTLMVVPGRKDSRATLYEDDGETMAYVNEGARTEFTKTTFTEGGKTVVRVTVLPRKGNFKGAERHRDLRILLEGFPVPEKITVNGKAAGYNRFLTQETDVERRRPEWKYDGKNLAADLRIAETRCNGKTVVDFVFDTENFNAQEKISGIKGLLGRMAQLTPETKMVFSDHVDWFSMLPVEFLKIAQGSSIITENPEKLMETVSALDTEDLVRCFEGIEKLPKDFTAKVKAQVVIQK